MLRIHPGLRRHHAAAFEVATRLSMSETSKKSRKLPAAARRRAVGSSAAQWVSTRRLYEASPIPLLVEPAVDSLELIAWARRERSHVEQLLAEHRALLFRGFPIDSIGQFEEFVDVTSDGERLEYRDRTTPRTTEGNRIYTATVHPPDQRINPHNEGTYWIRWATKLYFCCLTAPESGGQTPIDDVRRVYDRIDPDVRERFSKVGFMLVRNYNDGFGLPWQEVFQTESKDEVGEFCRVNQIELEWRDGDRLTTRQVRPAVRCHPVSGEKVWFNHAAFYHHSTLEPDVRQALVAEFGEKGLPYNTYYGDGAPIEPQVAQHLRDAYEAEKVIFSWQRGDVMLLDNMSIAHAREPFLGERLVLVAMTDAVDEQACSPE